MLIHVTIRYSERLADLLTTAAFRITNLGFVFCVHSKYQKSHNFKFMPAIHRTIKHVDNPMQGVFLMNTQVILITPSFLPSLPTNSLYCFRKALENLYFGNDNEGNDRRESGIGRRQYYLADLNQKTSLLETTEDFTRIWSNAETNLRRKCTNEARSQWNTDFGAMPWRRRRNARKTTSIQTPTTTATAIVLKESTMMKRSGWRKGRKGKLLLLLLLLDAYIIALDRETNKIVWLSRFMVLNPRI